MPSAELGPNTTDPCASVCVFFCQLELGEGAAGRRRSSARRRAVFRHSVRTRVRRCVCGSRVRMIAVGVAHGRADVTRWRRGWQRQHERHGRAGTMKATVQELVRYDGPASTGLFDVAVSGPRSLVRAMTTTHAQTGAAASWWRVALQRPAERRVTGKPKRRRSCGGPIDQYIGKATVGSALVGGTAASCDQPCTRRQA